MDLFVLVLVLVLDDENDDKDERAVHGEPRRYF